MSRVLKETKLSGFLLVILFLILWELSVASGAIKLVSWPAFSSVMRAWVKLIVDGEMLRQLTPSLERLAVGYMFAVVSGVFIGLLMGYFQTVHNLLEPLVEILRPIPPPAYLPMAILFFGIGDHMKVFMIVFACFFPVLLNTASGVKAVDPVQINTGRTFGLNSRQILQQIIIPAASPHIFTGMRISLAVSLILTVIAEMVAGNNGIGFFILLTQRSFRVSEMYAGVITVGMLGYLLNLLFLWAERRMMGWHFGATAMDVR
ncbi:MAG TPA: ABC transporter permease [Anaerolineales bacterium]|jgi:ABC-type nitrate/sulfonate/bicarbonate transport system permease component|nr:ABC transporter permease [Anaerolineales bacterium]|tara:strand:+ start:1148 stop:1930 length:783 start_codon:yes stop_codon:yes gene_type:complete